MKNTKPFASGPSMDVSTTVGEKEASLGREIQAKIGQQLRAVYDDVVNQGVPDRFADLLRQLEQSGTKGRAHES
jgi:hypothetical protein